MSTFFVTLAVVVMALAGAVAVAVKDPEQPATLRGHTGRERRRRHHAPRPAKKAVRREPALPPRPVAVPASVELSGFTDHWIPAAMGPTVWFRLRSGVVLTFLLTVLGAVIAMVIAGFVVFVALAVRSAVS